MDARIDLVDLDYEYKIWKNNLIHFTNELKIIHARLRELHDLSIPITETQLEAYKENLQRCEKKIILQEEEMAAFGHDFPISKQHEIFVFHLNIKQQMLHIKETQQSFLNILDGFQHWKS